MVAPFADDATHQLRELVRTGRFRDALDRYRREEATPADAAADARLLAATAATRLGQFAVGRALAEQALRRFGARGDLDGRMRALNLLGVWRSSAAPGRGRAVLAEALRLATHLDDSLIAARACNNLASVLHLRGRPDEAVGLYRGALLSLPASGRPPRHGRDLPQPRAHLPPDGGVPRGGQGDPPGAAPRRVRGRARPARADGDRPGRAPGRAGEVSLA